MLIRHWLQNWRVRRQRMRSCRRRDVSSWRLNSLPAECLESRALLSNVAVTTDTGIITLSGDTGDHSFTAAVVDLSGVLNLVLTGASGTEFTFGSTTAATIDIPLSTIGTINGLEITMQGGADTISFDATNLGTISGDAIMKLGDGINSLTFQNATVTGRAVVDGGSGVDTIQLTGDTLGAVSICTGEEGDTIGLTTVTITGQPTHPDFVGCADGLDGFKDGLQRLLEHARHGLDGALYISTGCGDDIVNLTSATGDSGEDSDGPW